MPNHRLGSILWSCYFVVSHGIDLVSNKHGQYKMDLALLTWGCPVHLLKGYMQDFLTTGRSREC